MIANAKVLITLIERGVESESHFQMLMQQSELSYQQPSLAQTERKCLVCAIIYVVR